MEIFAKHLEGKPLSTPMLMFQPNLPMFGGTSGFRETQVEKHCFTLCIKVKLTFGTDFKSATHKLLSEFLNLNNYIFKRNIYSKSSYEILF